MKIHRLTAENFKRLYAVEITPDGAVVELRGANAQGKSSVLDAIFAALGGADAAPGKPIRIGEDRAEINVDLGEYLVRRRFTDRGPDKGITTDVIVEAPSGARFPSPQRLLDELIGKISFDPLAFTRMKPADQLQALRQVVTIDADLDALDGLNRRDFEARTYINREAASLRAQMEAIRVPPDAPTARQDQQAALTELDEAYRFNGEIAARAQRRERAVEIAANHRAAAALHREAAAREIRDAEEAEAAAARLEEQLMTAEPLPAKKDTDALRAATEQIGAANRAFELRERRDGLQLSLDGKLRDAARLTDSMAARSEQKRAAIAAAKFPVDGLSIGDDGDVLYNGVPFGQASQAEKIQVSTAIAMAANPKLRVLTIRDGSLLDTASMKLLAGIVEAHDYQLWLEVTDDTGAVGIVIEDGRVKGADKIGPDPADEGAATPDTGELAV